MNAVWVWSLLGSLVILGGCTSFSDAEVGAAAGGAGEGGGGGSGGAAGSPAAGGAGAGGQAGVGGAIGAACCEPSSEPGCAAPSVAQCVCRVHPACCEERWGKSCVLAVSELGCADPCASPTACPGAPAGGLSCAAAIPLAPGTPAQGRTLGLASKSSASCGGGLAPEVWYSYTTTGPARLRVRVLSLYSAELGCDAPLQPVVYVRDGCEAGAAELACGGYTVETDRLDPGTYRIAVDGRLGDAGEFSIEVDELAPCEGDVDCVGAPAAPACNTLQGRCVRCTSDVHCTGAGAPACDDRTAQCVPCVVDAHCKDPGAPRCSKEEHRCVACLSDLDCKTEGAPFCLKKQGICSACRGDDDCKDPAKPACNAPTGTCVQQGNCCEATAGVAGCVDSAIEACVCAKDPFCCETSWDQSCALQVEGAGCGLCGAACAKTEDCTDPARPVCIPGAGRCAECAGPANCKDPSKPLCKAGAFRCVACEQDSDCKEPGAPRCDKASNTCTVCVEDADCKDEEALRCVAGACVACRDEDDCSGGLPACEAGACVACTSDVYCTNPSAPACNVAKKTCVKQGNCCEATAEVAGCEQPSIEACVCAVEPSCCIGAWTAACVALVETLGCSLCGPSCQQDQDCTDPARPVCVPGLARCGGCAKDADCKAPEKPSCNPGVFRCVAPCCAVTGEPGCSASTTIRDCVCAKDPFCCETSWDSSCALQVVSLGCGSCP